MTIPIIDVESSCKKLKQLCEQKGYTAKDLQLALGLESRQSCYKWFAGKNIPSIDNLLIITHLLNVKLEDIIITNEINTQKENNYGKKKY